MNTKFRNIGIALILALGVIMANATENRKFNGFALEPKLEIEQWMTDAGIFNIVIADSETGTIIDIAVSNKSFSTLVDAVTKAELVDALSAEEPFTVFAPTNEAFDKLFEQLGVSGVSDLTAEQLTPILTYHVVSGKVMSSDLTNSSVETLNGQKIHIDLNEGVQINDSKVVTADISGNNGVIHAIDKVLVPKKDGGCNH